jgi:hypothetical protein
MEICGIQEAESELGCLIYAGSVCLMSGLSLDATFFMSKVVISD